MQKLQLVVLNKTIDKAKKRASWATLSSSVLEYKK